MCVFVIMFIFCVSSVRIIVVLFVFTQAKSVAKPLQSLPLTGSTWEIQTEVDILARTSTISGYRTNCVQRVYNWHTCKTFQKIDCRTQAITYSMTITNPSIHLTKHLSVCLFVGLGYGGSWVGLGLVGVGVGVVGWLVGWLVGWCWV